MRKLIFKLIFLLPIPLIIGVVNVMWDPTHIFQHDFLDEVALQLSAGKHVANLNNYDERRLQKVYIDKRNTAPELIVLGSSRMMVVGQRLFPGVTFFNHAVSGADLPDLVAIVQMYLEKGLKPAYLIWGLDPWIVSGYGINYDIRWLSLQREYQQFLDAKGIDYEQPTGVVRRLIKEKIRRLLSFQYFMKALGRWGDSHYFTREAVLDCFIKYSDGSLSWNKKTRSKAQHLVDRGAAGYVLNMLQRHPPGRYFAIDPQPVLILETLLRTLKEKGVQILFFLPPYHPLVYEQFCENRSFKNIHAVETYFINLAKRCEFPLIGSFDPGQIGMDNKDFYDSVHIRKEALERVFQRRLNLEGIF